jgi:MinD-like ATPase involved in chromosome partitioning or flagellar assembly
VAVVAFGSVRSCGVTTTVAALAAVWPDDRRRVVVELDPAGGTLAASCGLRVAPGLVSLATASRRHMEPDALWTHSQQLPCGGAVVVGPPSAAQAQRALQLMTDAVAQFADLDADVLADCGRLDPTSPARADFDGAEVQVLVARPQLPDLHHLAAWLEDASSKSAQSIVVLAGSGPYPREEISAALGVEVVERMPHDPGGVARLAQASTARAAGRSALLRAARSLAATIVERLTEQAESPLPESLSSEEGTVDASDSAPASAELQSEEARS